MLAWTETHFPTIWWCNILKIELITVSSGMCCKTNLHQIRISSTRLCFCLYSIPYSWKYSCFHYICVRAITYLKFNLCSSLFYNKLHSIIWCLKKPPLQTTAEDINGLLILQCNIAQKNKFRRGNFVCIFIAVYCICITTFNKRSIIKYKFKK